MQIEIQQTYQKMNNVKLMKKDGIVAKSFEEVFKEVKSSY